MKREAIDLALAGVRPELVQHVIVAAYLHAQAMAEQADIGYTSDDVAVCEYLDPHVDRYAFTDRMRAYAATIDYARAIGWTTHSAYAPRHPWDTSGDSHVHAPSAKLTPAQVIEIYDRAHGDEYMTVIAQDYDVSDCAIGQIKRGETWGHVTQHFDRETT